MTEPLKISLEDLRIIEPDDTDTPDERLQFDVGNLCVFDPRGVKKEWLKGEDVEQRIAQVAAEATGALLRKLSQLPRPRSNTVLALPSPVTLLPRSKPLPTEKPLSRWETFAKSKGIRKRKKDRKVWDEGTGEWRRRYGFKRVNDPKDVVILDAKPNDVPGESPFQQLAESKKERVDRQKRREVRNVERAVKAGHRLPNSVQLVANLPPHGKGHPLQRKNLKDGVDAASKMAGLSTASMGKFDVRQKGEAPDERISKKKKQTLVNAHKMGEKHYLEKMSQKLVKAHSENILDVDKAVGRLEADKRRHRHQEKIEEQLSGKNKQRSQKKISKRRKDDKPSLPKLKITSRQKNIKRRIKKAH